MKKNPNQDHETTPKSLENTIRNENHIFDNVDQLVTNRTSKNHKNDDKISPKSSTHGITKRHHKMMSPKSQTCSQNGHEMVTKCHQNRIMMASSHHVKKWCLADSGSMARSALETRYNIEVMRTGWGTRPCMEAMWSARLWLRKGHVALWRTWNQHLQEDIGAPSAGPIHKASNANIEMQWLEIIYKLGQ